MKIKCDLPESTTQTDQVTTTEDTFTTKTKTVTTTISDSPLTNSKTHSTITEEKKITKGIIRYRMIISGMKKREKKPQKQLELGKNLRCHIYLLPYVKLIYRNKMM